MYVNRRYLLFTYFEFRKVLRPNQHIISHFGLGDDSFQTMNALGAGNKTATNKKKTYIRKNKHKADTLIK